MIRNRTTGKVISTQERYCIHLYSQARGLMFRPKQNLIMKFPEEQIISLHMFFVFYPIDVLVLDKNKTIVEIKRHFKPFTLWSSTWRGKYVVEVAYPQGYKLGDRLELNQN